MFEDEMNKSTVEDLQDYVNFKLRVLKQLGIKITYDIVTHIRSLKSEIAIDNYCHSVIVNS